MEPNTGKTRRTEVTADVGMELQWRETRQQEFSERFHLFAKIVRLTRRHDKSQRYIRVVAIRCSVSICKSNARVDSKYAIKDVSQI